MRRLISRNIRRRFHRIAGFSVAACFVWRSLLFGGEIDAARLPPAAKRSIEFGKDVLPVLKEHCFDCHQGRGAVSGFRLDLRTEILGETNGQPLAIVGRSAESLLVQLAAGLGEKQMPPKDEGEPLSAEQVGVLRAWIDQGLSWDEKLLPPADLAAPHWAFEPVRRPSLPNAPDAQWLKTPVDSFVAAGHAARGLAPAPEAHRRALIRRASLDLTGLPPDPEEVRAFLEDRSPDAYERLIDRLLASPRYGERWGRHWLDAARYADSEGYESNHLRPYAWRYRDYVVASFNGDKPFDHFLRQQIAGDELLPYSDENLIATGFLAAARLSSNEEDKTLQRNLVLVDITNALASSVLGLTLGCAQCHNHKFDPLSQRDYYRLHGLFVRGQPNNLALKDEAAWQAYEAAKPPEYDLAAKLKESLYEKARAGLLAERRQKLSADMQAALLAPEAERTPRQRELARQADLELQILVSQVEAKIAGDDRSLYDALKKKLESLEKTLPDKPQTWGYYSPASPTAVEVLPMKGFYPLTASSEELRAARAFLLVRGNEHRRGPEVEPGWPMILGPQSFGRQNFGQASSPMARASSTPTSAPAEAPAEASSERQPGESEAPWPQGISYELARSRFVDWLVSRENPLTARVWVNRIWQHHFGRGLVATPDDFGVKGSPPSHPELLDYLACELIESGWSVKHMQRLIVLSSTYRQSARLENNARTPALDPDNVYLARWSPRRLEAEALRDLCLAVSGELDLQAGGKGAPDDAARRRSLYLLQKRDAPPEMQRLFDGPTANESCARRNTTTVALQPLYLLNSPAMVRRASAFADRVRASAGEDSARQIEAAFELSLGRPPERDELREAQEYLRIAQEQGGPLSPLAGFCQVLLNLNEFAYLR